MTNTPTYAESSFLSGSLARAFALVPLALFAMGTTNAFAQSPAAAAPPAGSPQAPPTPAAAPAESAAQPAAPPVQPMPPTAQPPAPVPQPYYPAPPPGYPQPRPYPVVQPAPPREPSFLSGSLAGGFGIPYGVIGGGFTFGFDYLSLIAGAGTTVYAGPGYSAGLRLHFLDTSNRWRPHLTAVYGTTTAYKVTMIGGTDMTGVLHGFAFYAGVDQDFGELGGWFATYGIGVITHEKFPTSVTDALGYTPDAGNPVKFMVAFGYRFGGQ
jgi:hypothetical protein